MVLQKTVISIGIVTAAIIVILLIFHAAIKRYDPQQEPKGLVLLAIMGVSYVDGLIKNSTNEKVASQLGPYLASAMVYIFISNIAGLFSVEPPTSNYSVTLTLALITCILIEYFAIQAKGLKGQVKSLFEPLAPFVVINLISKLGTLLSLSLRLFGNILSGSILMSVIYQMLAQVSAKIPLIGGFNFIAVIIAPVLHFYFDLFSGFMQTYLFSVLSVSFIGNELPDK